MNTEVQVLELGDDVRFVGLPSEIYVEHGALLALATNRP
jgi:hypothetical protein